MPTKFPLHSRVDPENINKLSSNLKNIFSAESIDSLLETIFKKMNGKQTLEKHETKLALDWHHNLDEQKNSIIRDYFQDFSSKNEIFQTLSEYIEELKQLPVIELILSLPRVESTLTQQQTDSFKHFISGTALQDLKGDGIIEYIENLRIIPSQKFSSGQKLVASKFISSSDFSRSFETNFDSLVHFLKKSGVEDENVIIKFLDRQLVSLIKNDESSVTAKAYRKELGFSKYINFVETSIKDPSSRNLEGYRHLTRLISKFEQAVQILSEQEAVRGSFWMSYIQRLDGVKMKLSTSRKYKIGVAFFVGDFAFCDFGPTGNQIHVFDRDIFLKKVEHQDNWQQDGYLTERLSENKYPHVGDWQEKTRNLIKWARNYG